MIGQVTEGQERRTAGSDDYRLGKASPGDLVVLLEAVLAAKSYVVVLVGAAVAVGKAENGIGYLRLQAVLEGIAA
jgi:hypothetical protein